MEIVLVAPQIAPNTGNVIRLCANLGARLHLVEPLGFSMDARLLRRGGLDYHELTQVQVHPAFADVRVALAGSNRRWFALTGRGARRYDTVDYGGDDVLVFGCESAGLPDDVLREFADDERVAIPMRPGNRSLNLANAVAVVAYEAWRRGGFEGAAEALSAGTAESIAASTAAEGASRG